MSRLRRSRRCPPCESGQTRPEPGDTLYGFCGGAFGRDSYGNKTVVALGRDWLVAREEDGHPMLAVGPPEDLAYYLTEDP